MSPSSGEFPAIQESLISSWSLDSDSLISSLFLLREVLAWVSTAEVIVDIIWFIDDKDCRWGPFSSFRPFKTSVDWPFAVELVDRFVVVITVVSLVDFFRETDFPLSIVWVLSGAEVCESRTKKNLQWRSRWAAGRQLSCRRVFRSWLIAAYSDRVNRNSYYIHDSNTGMGVQLELWAWVFNAVRVSLQSSNKILVTRDT